MPNPHERPSGVILTQQADGNIDWAYPPFGPNAKGQIRRVTTVPGDHWQITGLQSLFTRDTIILSNGVRTPVPIKEAVEVVEQQVEARIEQMQQEEEKRRQEQEANRLRGEQEQKEQDDMDSYIRSLFD